MYKKFLLTSFSSNKYSIVIFIIIFLVIFLRLYNFSDRWGMGSDDMRDVAIAKEALNRRELPLIGSFSSAGPFVFGPLFYWFVMLSYILLPFTLQAPWILLTTIGLATIYVFIYIGQLLGGKKLSLILGILSATSPQLITRSIALNQHSLIGITSVLLILFYVLFWQRRKIIYAFLMGLSLGIALNLHYQAINLFIFFPMLLLIPKLSLIVKLKAIIVMFLGVFIPSLPLLWWDSHQEFANIRNIIDYLLIGQYRIYFPNSWRLFLFNYLPNYWSFVEGGYFMISLGIMFFIGTLFLFLVLLKKVSRLIFILTTAFFILLVINRYYRGERFEGYLMYLAPFIIIISGWCIGRLVSFKFELFKREFNVRVIGVIILFIVVFANLLFVVNQVLSATNKEQKEEVKRIEKILFAKYPDQKFSLYDYEWRTSDKSYPLSAFLEEKHKISKEGVPIGIIWESKMYQIDKKGARIITPAKWDFIIDLTKEKTFNLKQKRWVSVSQESIYNDLMKWTKTEKLVSSFSF